MNQGIHNPDISIIPDLEAEISKAKNRLTITNVQREELERTLLSIKNDIETQVRHSQYLKDIQESKEIEISKKGETIKNLDSQISDKQKRHDELQHEIGVLSITLNEYKDKIIESEEKLSNHHKKMTSEREDMLNLKSEALKEHNIVKEKHQKLIDFLNEIK